MQALDRKHKHSRWFVLIGLTLIAITMQALAGSETKNWAVHDMDRPRPPIITPGEDAIHGPPSDAIVLFDGSNLDQWRSGGAEAKWTVEDGIVTVAKKAGAIETRRAFGDCQLHLEWSAPMNYNHKHGQSRGNSGVFFMGRYEVQVLDSYKNDTYPDGQTGSLYGQYPPLVNASRKPGEWQVYDIIFRRPRFDAAGAVVQPATVTLLHNGVLVQDHVALLGATAHKVKAKYAAHPDKRPIRLQDHGDPVRYRNIWLRELE